MPHRVAHRRLVGHAGLLAFLAPADHDEQRVVDRDAEPDQRDEELDDERDVGDAGERPDQQEGRGDRDERHEQRHERHERAKDEGQHEERTQGRQQGADEDAGAVGLVLACGGAQGVEPRHLDGRAGDRDVLQRRLRRLRLLPTGIGAALGRDVDEGEGRAPVVGDEGPVAGGGIRGGPGPGTAAWTFATAASSWRAMPGESTVVPFGSCTTGTIGAMSPPLP